MDSTTNTNIKITTETLADVKARQAIWTFTNETAGLDDTDLVITYTRCTPFGNYLLAVEVA